MLFILKNLAFFHSSLIRSFSWKLCFSQCSLYHWFHWCVRDRRGRHVPDDVLLEWECPKRCPGADGPAGAEDLGQDSGQCWNRHHHHLPHRLPGLCHRYHFRFLECHQLFSLCWWVVYHYHHRQHHHHLFYLLPGKCHRYYKRFRVCYQLFSDTGEKFIITALLSSCPSWPTSWPSSLIRHNTSVFLSVINFRFYTCQEFIIVVVVVIIILLLLIIIINTPQWGAADAEIKVPSSENTELKRSPFQAWSGSV